MLWSFEIVTKEHSKFIDKSKNSLILYDLVLTAVLIDDKGKKKENRTKENHKNKNKH